MEPDGGAAASPAAPPSSLLLSACTGLLLELLRDFATSALLDTLTKCTFLVPEVWSLKHALHKWPHCRCLRTRQASFTPYRYEMLTFTL